MKKAIFTQHSGTRFSAKIDHDHYLSVEYDIRGVWCFEEIFHGQARNKFHGVAGYLLNHISHLGYEHNLAFENKILNTETRWSDEEGNHRQVRPELKACVILKKETEQ